MALLIYIESFQHIGKQAIAFEKSILLPLANERQEGRLLPSTLLSGVSDWEYFGRTIDKTVIKIVMPWLLWTLAFNVLSY